MGDFTFWLKLSLSLNFDLSTYLSQKVKWYQKFGLSRYLDRSLGSVTVQVKKYLLRPKFSRNNLAKVGSICVEEIALAFRAKLSLSRNPLQLLTLAEWKHGDYSQSYTYE